MPTPSRRDGASLQLLYEQKRLARSIGVQNRQPQGFLVPFSFSGADVFDSVDTMDVFIFIPDEMYRCIRTKVMIRFREFFSAAKTAATSGSLTSDSGGGATSGSSSASSSGSGQSHSHQIGAFEGTVATPTTRGLKMPMGVGGLFVKVNVPTDAASGDPVATYDENGHSHGIPHTHSTPNHQHTVPGHAHALTYGVFKEAYPASHSVTLKVYELEDTTWLLRGTIAGLTGDIEELNLTPYIGYSGVWRLELKSDAAQPNGGRLGCDVAGFLLGAIKAA